MHFTYSENIDSNNLCQGDVIKPSAGLIAILEKECPKIKTNDIRYYSILTQSCDLVKRNGAGCKAEHIHLAVMRQVNVAFQQELFKYQYEDIEKNLNIINQSHVGKLNSFMERLLNNNENDYFYYQQEKEFGLDENYCAFLRLSITLDLTPTLYDLMIESKILQLKDSFQHKIGYFVGEIYSRVGTDDWVPSVMTREDFIELYTGRVKSYIDPLDIIELEAPVHRKVLKELKKLPPDQQSLEHLHKLLGEVKTSRQAIRAEVFSTISEELEKHGVIPDTISKVCTGLQNNVKITSNLKQS